MGWEARKNGMIGAEEAANLTEVPNVPQKGTRLGNWLTREQAKELLAVPDRSTLKGKRDYVILAVLVGCALLREELAMLDVDTIQLRERSPVESLLRLFGYIVGKGVGVEVNEGAKKDPQLCSGEHGWSILKDAVELGIPRLLQLFPAGAFCFPFLLSPLIFQSAFLGSALLFLLVLFSPLLLVVASALLGLCFRFGFSRECHGRSGLAACVAAARGSCTGQWLSIPVLFNSRSSLRSESLGDEGRDVQNSTFGTPRSILTRFSTRTTSSPFRLWPASIATASRV